MTFRARGRRKNRTALPGAAAFAGFYRTIPCLNFCDMAASERENPHVCPAPGVGAKESAADRHQSWCWIVQHSAQHGDQSFASSCPYAARPSGHPHSWLGVSGR